LRNDDNTLSVFVTNVDPIVEGLPLAATARRNAIAANQLFKTMPPAYEPPGSSYGSINAELIKPLSPEMRAKIQAYGTPVSK